MHWPRRSVREKVTARLRVQTPDPWIRGRPLPGGVWGEGTSSFGSERRTSSPPASAKAERNRFPLPLRITCPVCTARCAVPGWIFLESHVIPPPNHIRDVCIYVSCSKCSPPLVRRTHDAVYSNTRRPRVTKETSLRSPRFKGWMFLGLLIRSSHLS